MENKAQEKKQKIDWKKKGRGWLPDYPDLRDYNPNDDIKTNLTLKVENTTAKFELFTNTFKSFAELLNDSVHTNQFKLKIKEFENQLNLIDSGILFKKVKIHKLLISGENQEIQHILINVPCESILPKQILDLKKYLGTLVLYDYLSFPQELLEKPPKELREKLPKELREKLQKNFSTHQEVPGGDQSSLNMPEEAMTLLKKEPSVVQFWINWMKETIYDETIVALVKQFQDQAGIEQDGIVGSETYNTLSDCFTEPEKLLQIKNSEKPTSQAKIKLLPVASLIPIEAYDKILDILKSKCAEQICKELREKNNDVFEKLFLQEIQISENHFQKILPDIGEDFTSGKENEDLTNEIRKKLDSFQKNAYPETKDIIELLKNKQFVFHIIEPIASVIIRSIYPLAQWKNQDIEEIVEKGFYEFSVVINDCKKNIPKNQNKEDINRKLAERAIRKVNDDLKEDVKEFLNKDEKDEKSKKFIFFYFLLRKYLKSFESSISAEETGIHHRQEFFEIAAENSTEQEDKNEIFPTFSLYILLVSNKFLVEELDKNEKQGSEKQKLYLFLPSVVDLSFWCSPVRDQGSLNSCTAFAAVALLEYFDKRNSNHYTEASPLFLYKAARNKMNATGDTGASIRETMKVLALFGVPPEESWPYDEDKVDDEPLPYCYAYAQNYKILKYFLLDYPGIPTENLLFQIKAVLAAGFPCIFGFTIYTSAYENSNSEKGHIPYPDREKDKVVGAHTVVAVGYDDDKLIQCADRKKYSKGAFLIRNSWGPEWGKDGYGWLPYDYVLAGLTSAWWSLLNSEWFDENNFGAAAKGGEGPTGQP